MIINPNQPVEELVGMNYGIIRQRLANTHIGQSTLELCRIARPGPMKNIPVELRRGWAKCVLETIAEYRSTWIDVTSSNLTYEQQAGVWK